jgi:integrase
MPFELARVSLKDIDLEKGALNARGFKGHSSRVFKLKSETLAMLKEYVQKYYKEYPFAEADWMGKIWGRIRNRTAEKLKAPCLRSIRLEIITQHHCTTEQKTFR